MATDPGEFTIDAMICDSAVTAEGKLYIQGGGWDRVNAAGLPVVVSRIGLAVVIGVPYTQTHRNHVLRIRLEGQDGPLPLGIQRKPDGETSPLMEVGAQFIMGRPPHLQPGERQLAVIAVNLDKMKFDNPGSFSFTFTIGDAEINRLPFTVAGPMAVTIAQ